MPSKKRLEDVLNKLPTDAVDIYRLLYREGYRGRHDRDCLLSDYICKETGLNISISDNKLYQREGRKKPKQVACLTDEQIDFKKKFADGEYATLMKGEYYPDSFFKSKRREVKT